MPLKPRHSETVTVPTTGGGSKAVEVATKDKTRSGVPFLIGRPREGGAFEAHIVPSERHRLGSPQIRQFQEAAKRVQPLLDGERVGEAVGVLRDVE